MNKLKLKEIITTMRKAYDASPCGGGKPDVIVAPDNFTDYAELVKIDSTFRHISTLEECNQIEISEEDLAEKLPYRVYVLTESLFQSAPDIWGGIVYLDRTGEEVSS